MHISENQPWRCLVCHEKGALDLDVSEDAYQVMQEVLEAHRTASPACEGGASTVQVLNQAITTEWPPLPEAASRVADD